MALKLIFLGPPGVGKGTQAERLANDRGLAHISTGNILRSEVEAASELGTKAKQYMDSGELVPDELVVAMVARRIDQPDCRAGYILDGFPRTMGQAEALEETLDARGETIDKALYFSAPDETLIKRLSGRRSCPSCGANYHVENMPPEKDGICDRCGSELIQRDDDRPETIRNRLDVYKAQTEELIQHYRRAGLLVEIDSTGPVDEIARATARAVEA
jgi:adenylate kinase